MTLATPEYLSHLRSLFPANSSIQNPYAYVIGIVFAANNKPPETVAVYQHAIADTDDPAGVTRKFREALFKTAVLYGAPRMINALLEVEKVSTVPAESPYRLLKSRTLSHVR
jgi:hypothetical protein